MNNIKKLIVYLVGAFAIIISEAFGVPLTDEMQANVVQLIILALTGLGVYQLRNVP